MFRRTLQAGTALIFSSLVHSVIVHPSASHRQAGVAFAQFSRAITRKRDDRGRGRAPSELLREGDESRQKSVGRREDSRVAITRLRRYARRRSREDHHVSDDDYESGRSLYILSVEKRGIIRLLVSDSKIRFPVPYTGQDETPFSREVILSFKNSFFIEEHRI